MSVAPGMRASDEIPALYGVVGWPLAQSLSPLLHNTAFTTLGMAAVYTRWEIPPERLPAFVDSVRLLSVRGCSVTIPHKVALLSLLDEVSPLARRVGAANTIYWKDGRLCGENTDVEGFLSPLAGEDLADGDALLLGAGGAARAVAAGLAGLGPERRPRCIRIATPSDSSHLPLAEELGLTPLRWQERHHVPARLVVNCTPTGMRGKSEEATPYDFALADAHGRAQSGGPAAGNAAGAAAIAYDIVYNPLETRFLREARKAGRRCLTGLDMFFGQGAAQFRLWTGQAMPLQGRAALLAALQPSDRG